MKSFKLTLASLLLTLCGGVAFAQPGVYMINYGDMDHWIDRQIKESGIIGGDTKHVWAIGPARRGLRQTSWPKWLV